MFQTFEVATSPETGPARLEKLRGALADNGLDGFIVPRADRFQGEYVAPCDDRLAWLTGFTGSAGFACILPQVAGVFVDGRYRVQVRTQVANVFSPVNWPEQTLAGWLSEQNAAGHIGFDPWLHTIAQIEDLQKAMSGRKAELVPSANMIDAVWVERPAPPCKRFSTYPDELAGETSAEKRKRLAEELRKAGQGSALICAPDSVAWLLNIRGSDIPRNPVPHAMALLKADGKVVLFCAAEQTEALDLGPNVTVQPEAELGAVLNAAPLPIRLDRDRTPFAVSQMLDPSCISFGQDPCVLPKACKTPAEISGARAAHLRDGAAMVRFLAWLDEAAPRGDLTEIDVVKALESFRRESGQLLDISFETICGAGPNGAIVHYRVNEDTNRTVRTGELLLVDSGGQYIDGTTDITRTIAISATGQAVGETEKACYTRVLRGVIALSCARFPKGVAGSDLDALARYPLWQAGQDFDHGTGHGVGAYLCVHEGPQGISRRARTPLAAGMIVSNEPGYYREGAFGIRIENLITVKPAEPLAGGDDRAMLDFETLTFVPFDRKLIAVEQLTAAERDWIDAYHRQTEAKIGPLVDGHARDWLAEACGPLAAPK